MLVSKHYLGGTYLPYDPANPQYEQNILRLAEKNPRHPEVQRYRQRLVAEGKVGEVVDGQAQPVHQDQDVEQMVREMVEMVDKNGPGTEPKFKSNDEIERAFADGKI